MRETVVLCLFKICLILPAVAQVVAFTDYEVGGLIPSSDCISYLSLAKTLNPNVCL